MSKKTILLITILSLFSFNFAHAATFEGGPEITVGESITISDFQDGESYSLFNSNSLNGIEQEAASEVGNTVQIPLSFPAIDLPIGDYIIFVTPEDGDCYSVTGDYNDCNAEKLQSPYSFSVIAVSQNGFTSMLASANDSFSSSIGFTPSEATSWTGRNLTSPFIGSFFAFIYSILGWMAAIATIGIILGWAYIAYKSMFNDLKNKKKHIRVKK